MPLIRGKLVLYLKSAPSALSNSEISRKNKNGYLSGNNYFMWVFLGQNFKELLCYLKSAPSNLCHCKISQKKGKILRQKNDLFRYFWARIFKSYCRISNEHLQICRNARLLGKKSYKKIKLPKFGNRNISFLYFQGRNLKSYCHI